MAIVDYNEDYYPYYDLYHCDYCDMVYTSEDIEYVSKYDDNQYFCCEECRNSWDELNKEDYE